MWILYRPLLAVGFDLLDGEGCRWPLEFLENRDD